MGHQLTVYQPPEIFKNNYFVAITGEKIATAPEIKIREALRFVMIKIGLRGNNFPVGIEKSLILDHVRTNYGDLTPEEIVIAFEWMIDDRLNLEKSEKTCFENFSCMYLSTILNAYKKIKKKIDQPVELKQLETAREDIEFDADKFFETDFGRRLLSAVPGIKDSLNFKK